MLPDTLYDRTSSLPEVVARKSLSHSSSNVRIAALNLLVNSKSPNKFFSEESLNALRDNLQLMCSEADPGARMEFLGAFKKLCVRLQGVVETCRKFSHLEARREGTPPIQGQVEKLTTEVGWSQCLEEHIRFITFCFEMLTRDLGPSCSYQRHISALKCLHTALSNKLHTLSDVRQHLEAAILANETSIISTPLKSPKYCLI